MNKRKIECVVSKKKKKKKIICYQLKYNRASGIAFNLNRVSFFTELNFIQNKAKKIISKKGRIGNFFCLYSNYMIKSSLVDLVAVAWWLAACAWKPKVPVSSPAATYVQR